MRPEHPFRIRRTPTHPSCPIPIQPIPSTHPQIEWFPRSGEISEAQTPLLPFAPLLLPLPLQGEIKRGSSEATAGMPEAGPVAPAMRGKCPKDKGGTSPPQKPPSSRRKPGSRRERQRGRRQNRLTCRQSIPVAQTSPSQSPFHPSPSRRTSRGGPTNPPSTAPDVQCEPATKSPPPITETPEAQKAVPHR